MDSKLNTFILMVFALGCFGNLQAQNTQDEFESLKNEMLNQNKKLKASQFSVESSKASEGEAFTFGRTQIFQNYDETVFEPIDNISLYRAYGVSQEFDFPTVYTSKYKLNKVKTEIARNRYNLEELKQIKALQSQYQDYLLASEQMLIYDSIQKIYNDFSRMAKRKFEEGESNYLEKITAQSKANQISIEKTQVEQSLKNAILGLIAIVQPEDTLILKGKTLNKLTLNQLSTASDNLNIQALSLQEQMAISDSKLAKNQLLPGISASYFVRNSDALTQSFQGYQIGLNIPILFFGDRAKIKSAKLSAEAKHAELEDAKINLEQQKNTLINQYNTQQKALESYENHQLKVADEILKTAQLSYKSGEIDFFRYVQSIENAQRIKLEYLKLLRAYNESIISLNYFILN